jgi:hypothetical protein
LKDHLGLGLNELGIGILGSLASTLALSSELELVQSFPTSNESLPTLKLLAFAQTLHSGLQRRPISEEESEEEIHCCKELLVHDNNMTSVSSLKPKAFRLLLGWKGLEVQLARLGSFPPTVLGAEEEESPLEANEDKVALETLTILPQRDCHSAHK